MRLFILGLDWSPDHCSLYLKKGRIMPNMFGGSSTSKDYAPHMWVGDYFVGDSDEMKIGKWTYCFGETSDRIVVAVRHKVNKKGSSMEEDVPPDQIPKRVIAAAKDSYERREERIKLLEEEFNRRRPSG